MATTNTTRSSDISSVTVGTVTMHYDDGPLIAIEATGPGKGGRLVVNRDDLLEVIQGSGLLAAPGRTGKPCPDPHSQGRHPLGDVPNSCPACASAARD